MCNAQPTPYEGFLKHSFRVADAVEIYVANETELLSKIHALEDELREAYRRLHKAQGEAFENCLKPETYNLGDAIVNSHNSTIAICVEGANHKKHLEFMSPACITVYLNEDPESEV